MKKATVSIKLDIIMKDDGAGNTQVEVQIPQQTLGAITFKEVEDHGAMYPLTLTLSEAHKKYNYITFLKQGNDLDFNACGISGKTFSVYFIDSVQEFEALNSEEPLLTRKPDTTINAHKTVNRRFDSAAELMQDFDVADTVEMKLFTEHKTIAVKRKNAM